ncbi:MAG: PorP/SprF family type IX secretion system membrane protein [Flavobacteriales bacterium]|nr:PorP/SprF family type IX secretion system membrane protein [Flavobacteriales bacterium]
MKKIITYLFFVGTISATAQDIHFTMYDAMPITTNPATTGVFNGDFRGVINYRNQWASIGNPYKTYSVMIDGGLFKNKWKNGYLGAGLNFYKDVAGTTDFGTTKISLALSSIVYLNEKNSASVGLLGSWAQNSLNPSNLEWDSQFNGQYFDASAGSNETIKFESNNYVDFSAGALWAYGTGTKTLSSHDEFAMKVGAAFYHVTRPSRDVEFGDLDKLYSKFSFHTETHIGLANTKLALRPKFIAYLQGPARQFTGGMMFRYMLREESKYTGIFKEMAISVGGYYRFGDAFAPSVEFEISSFAIGFAYDMNVSDLTSATGGNGGPEIFIRIINPNPFSYGRGTKSSARFR